MENKINCRILFLKGRELCCYYYSYTLVAYCNNPCWILWPYRKALCHHLCYKSSCLVINHGIHQPIRTSRAESDWLRRMEVLVSCGGETCLNARLAFEWHRGQFGLKWCFFFVPSCNTVPGLCPIRSNSSIHYPATLKDWVRRWWDNEREIPNERMERDCIVA